MELWGIEALWRGLMIGIAVAAPIGPVNLICIHRTISRGRLNALMAGQGAAMGDSVFAVIAAFGLTAVSGFVTDWQVTIQIIGGVILIGMGIRTLLSDPLRPVAKGDDSALDILKVIAATFSLTITNPATLFGFAAIFAGVGGIVGGDTGEKAADYGYATTLVIGVWAGSTLWWLFITNLAALLRDRAEHGWLMVVQRVSGAIIIGFGLVVFARLLGLFDF